MWNRQQLRSFYVSIALLKKMLKCVSQDKKMKSVWKCRTITDEGILMPKFKIGKFKHINRNNPICESYYAIVMSIIKLLLSLAIHRNININFLLSPILHESALLRFHSHVIFQTHSVLLKFTYGAQKYPFLGFLIHSKIWGKWFFR
jgi:hypothetical protein